MLIFVLLASFIISQVAPFLQIFANAASSYGKLETTISRISPIDGTSDDGLVLDSISGDIELRNVSFTYPSRPDIEVIHDLSLHIPANKHTGIVGLSGSGKSTVAGLIGRLYDANQGDVLIDGHSVKDLNVRSLRRFIGTVAQNSALFDRSILENIAHGLVNSPLPEHAELQGALVGGSLAELVKAIQSGASIDEAVAKSSPTVQKIVKLADEAAEDANAYRFIEHFQYGFATTVGATGSQLSGGQKQRVVLARALIRQPAILILDEATASLDSISERIVQEALERVTDNRRTTVTIAHRLSTIKKADNIIVMRDGRIVEQGTPEELLGMEGGAFAAMVKLQCLQSPDATESETSSRPMSLDTIDRAKGYTNSLEKLPEFPIEDEPEDGEEETTEKPSISSLAGVLAMGRPYIGTILIGIVASTVVGGSYSAEAVIFGRTVGGLSTCLGAESIYSNGAFYGLMFFVLALIEFSANVLSTASFGRVAEKLLVKVRVLCLRFLFRQDIQWHESEGRSPSTLLSYISSDANSLAGLTGTIMGVILSILINMIAGIVLAHIIAWKIAVVLLSMIPILLLSGFLRLRIAASFHAQHQKAFAESVGLATEAVTSMRTIASFSLEAEALNVYERSLRGPYEATLKAIAHGNFWLAMAYSIGNLVYALAYWWGAKQIVEGIYTPTQFFTVLPALLFSAQSCGQLLSLAPDVSKATVAASRVLSLLKSQPNADGSSNFDSSLRTDLESVGALNEKGTPKDRRLGASVAFRDVHFSYPSRPEIPILRGLDISIAPGQFCALVGPSGAGKSTIIALLERFYRPSSGSVLLDNRDINKLSSTDFRDTIALVPQDSTLFEGTLRFNLELGARPGVMPTLSDIEDACKLANIHDTIVALPHGYETPCGPLGNQFSGGQLQRLSIARALVRKPKLLLLDESTSALDAESEQAILEGLEAATRGVSVLAIAHRARTVRKAHCIFVVVDGACRERGNHEELMGRSAWYHEMVAHQSIG
jgi:ATP-binding cassette subfamily B (MDR/TAP) protein 1